MKHCPKCQNTLHSIEKRGISVEKCDTCTGIFLEFMVLKQFIDGVNAEYECCLNMPEKQDFRADQKEKNYSCAHCQSPMDEREFNYGSGIHIDFCKSCGATFLAEYELGQILDFEYKRQYSAEGKKLQHQIELMGREASIQQNSSYDMAEDMDHQPFLVRIFGNLFR